MLSMKRETVFVVRKRSSLSRHGVMVVRQFLRCAITSFSISWNRLSIHFDPVDCLKLSWPLYSMQLIDIRTVFLY